MKNKKIKLIIKNVLCGFCICLALFFAFSVKAAQLDIVSKTQNIFVGQQFQVDLILNTQGESINAVEGAIAFTKNNLTLREIKDGGSIINFWVEKPRLSLDGNDFHFSGIIPGGYQEAEGLVFSLIFEAKQEGQDLVEIKDVKVLLNDGNGTETNTKTSNFQFLISKEAPRGFEFQNLSFKDIDPPESFIPEINRDLNVFDGKWFLVFDTQDKGIGIDYYKVAESKNSKIKEGKLIKVTSPYLLQDQQLRSYIFVEAVDKAGNRKMVFLAPWYSLKWYEFYWVWGIIVLGVITIVCFIKFKIKNAKKKSAI